MGNTINSEGVKVDSSKTDAITKMHVPQFLTKLQGFLGMISYLGKFIPNLAQVIAPLWALLKKDVVFNLQKPQLDAIEKLKTLITLSHILKGFDPNLPTRLKTDASSKGLGTLLEQNHGSLENPHWHPVEYLSRVLRDYEERCAQVEKETLFIVFGVQYFYKYYIAVNFSNINDHQPLESIFSISTVTCPPRTQPKNFFFDCRSMISSSSMPPVKQF